jgi:oxygen-independent coproporphyrinogen-3 oxidase
MEWDSRRQSQILVNPLEKLERRNLMIQQSESLRGQPANSPLIEPVTAAYIHIPFCVRKCAYCDFISYAGCAERLPAYVEAVIREIKNAAQVCKGPPLKSVFFGGGTPSLLPPLLLERLLQTLSTAFAFTTDVEISIEANPGTLAPDQLSAYHQSGCNRISFGVQSTKPHLLRLLGRIHEPEDVTVSIRQAVAAGFTRISADLMFGLPQQTVTDVYASIHDVLNLPVTHVSFYSLSLEDDTLFSERYRNHPELLPDDETERAQYETIIEETARVGMAHYEISNAALPGEQCRHNRTYWQAQPYYGFGAGAHGYVAGVRRGNLTGIDAYIQRICANDTPFAAAESAVLLTRSEQEQEFMLLGLRLLEGVDARTFAKRFGRRMFVRFKDEIADLCTRGLIIREKNGVHLTRTGLDLANQVFMQFV